MEIKDIREEVEEIGMNYSFEMMKRWERIRGNEDERRIEIERNKKIVEIIWSN